MAPSTFFPPCQERAAMSAESRGNSEMSKRFYLVTRDLHLYVGLFISPFVLVFSISVFFLVHAWRPRIVSETSTTRVVSAVPLPGDLQRLSGRPLIDALKPMLEKADVCGEVGFVRHLVKEEK